MLIAEYAVQLKHVKHHIRGTIQLVRHRMFCFFFHAIFSVRTSTPTERSQRKTTVWATSWFLIGGACFPSRSSDAHLPYLIRAVITQVHSTPKWRCSLATMSWRLMTVQNERRLILRVLEAGYRVALLLRVWVSRLPIATFLSTLRAAFSAVICAAVIMSDTFPTSFRLCRSISWALPDRRCVSKLRCALFR